MKKIILMFLISLVCVSNLFASDFNIGIGLVVPLGASISQKNQIHNADADADKNDGVLSGKKSAFEFGVGLTPDFIKASTIIWAFQ